MGGGGFVGGGGIKQDSVLGGAITAWRRRAYPVSLNEPLAGAAVQIARAAGFPRSAWNADFFALAILGEFEQTDWRRSITVAALPSDKAAAQEIEALVHLADSERPDLVDEIVDQDLGFDDYFAHLVMMSPGSHPETFKLLKSAVRVAEAVCVKLKLQYDRPRPQQLYPALMPLLDMPGHPSYPSGHALIATLSALCLGEAVPPAADALQALARRIGRNREIAGVHYESDTRAGQDAAQQAHALLKRCEGYLDLLERAKAEWAWRKAG